MIAVVAYITSLGLYALFIEESGIAPKWLIIRDLSDLKSHLISAIAAVLAVLFLQQTVIKADETDLMQLGVSVGLVILALATFLRLKRS